MHYAIEFDLFKVLGSLILNWMILLGYVNVPTSTVMQN